MEAVRELRTAAVRLEAEAGLRVRAAQRALATWTGPHAEVFADELRRRVREADDLAAACRRAAAALEQQAAAEAAAAAAAARPH